MFLWASCVARRFGESFTTTVFFSVTSETMTEAALKHVLVQAADQITRDNGTTIAASQVAILQMKVHTTFITDGA